MLILGLILMQGAASMSVKFPKPYIDLRKMSTKAKAKELVRQGYPAEVLDIKDNLIIGNYKKYTNTYKRGIEEIEAIMYDITDTIVEQQAVFHKDLVEKIKDPVIFPFEAVWLREDASVTVLFLPTAGEAHLLFRHRNTFAGIKELYLHTLFILQALEKNQAALIAVDRDGIVSNPFTYLRPSALTNIYRIDGDCYILGNDYYALGGLRVNMGNSGRTPSIIPAKKDFNTIIMIEYMLSMPYIKRFELKTPEDLAIFDGFMKAIFRARDYLNDGEGTKMDLKSLDVYIESTSNALIRQYDTAESESGTEASSDEGAKARKDSRGARSPKSRAERPSERKRSSSSTKGAQKTHRRSSESSNSDSDAGSVRRK